MTDPTSPALKLHVCRADGLAYSKWNVATPFRVLGDGPLELRPEAVEARVALAESLDEADVGCLPADWTSYQGSSRAEAVAYIGQAARLGKLVAIWVLGDHEVDLAWSNVIQFQHAFRRSRGATTRRRAVPPMFSDVVGPAFGGVPQPLPRGERPLVGFCGQTGSAAVEEAKRFAHKGLTRVERATGRSDAVPEPWGSHVRLRRQVLDRLAADPRIDTNFVMRDRYRGGLTGFRNMGGDEPLRDAQREYYENIRDTQYTVCIRGGGNFSVRLYEALCVGRIPLIIDSDALLPFPDHPFWREVALVVPARDLASLGSRLAAHHAEADDAGWIERQERARRFWLGHLCRRGYLAHLPELLRP